MDCPIPKKFIAIIRSSFNGNGDPNETIRIAACPCPALIPAVAFTFLNVNILGADARMVTREYADRDTILTVCATAR